MDPTPFATESQHREDAISDAWQHYREILDGISGRPYDQAEERAWEELQRELAEIERLFAPLGAI